MRKTRKESIYNAIIAFTLAMLAVSLIASAINNIYTQRKVLNILEKQEMRRTDYSEAKFVLGVIDDVFQNKYN
jgi:hypothetical protein